MAVYNTMFGMSEGFVAQIGPINSPKAPPNGFASDLDASQ